MAEYTLAQPCLSVQASSRSAYLNTPVSPGPSQSYTGDPAPMIPSCRPAVATNGLNTEPGV